MPGRRRVLLVAALTGMLFASLSALVVAHVRPLLGMDAAISAAALRIALEHPGWRAFALVVTNSGGPTVVTVAAVAAVLLLGALGRWRDAVFVAVAMAGSVGVRLILLNAIARPRPAERLAPAAGFSFPSGHTTESAAAALTALAVLWPFLRGGARRAIVASALLAWAGAVGISRVALVVHWPSDVVGGWLLATTVVLAASVIQRRPGPPSEPGGGQVHELDGGDPGRSRERGDQREETEEPPAPGQGSRAGERLHPADGDPVVRDADRA
jgi:undecaprenyl-diphosphatase